MFLFTTPSSPTESVPPPAITRPASGPSISGPVVQAIHDGAMASGVGFDYLLATARRESALDPAAKAATSSATGLFQFIEQTWLGVMKNAGPRLGLQAQADAITRQADGSYAVPDAGQRQAILDLRRDPKIATALAGALTQKNAESLGAALGREPTSGDLYVAHVLGAKGAASLIGTARTFPERAAALDLPEAAAANRALFYDRAGRPRSAAELYASLAAAAQGSVAVQGAAPGAAPANAPAGQAATVATATVAAFGGTGDLRSLFQTEQRGAVSDAAARLWQGRGAPQPAQRAAPTYFPRSETGAEMAALDDGPATTGSIATASLVEPLTAAATATAAGPALVNAPLPPRRPAEFAASGAMAAVAETLKTGLRTTLFAPRSGP